MASIPRVIWTFWAQGWEQAPAISRACLATWHRHNPGWQVRCLSNGNIGQYIDLADVVPDQRRKIIELEALSDIIRLELLNRHGGVWVDATLYCNLPLDGWLPEAAPEGFFAFAQPAPDRMVSSWCCAATPRHPIVQEWRDAVREYWHLHNRRHHYFWFHYLFADVHERSRVVRSLWNKTPKQSADGPHLFLPYRSKLPAPLSPEIREAIESPSTPVFKLTHRYDYDTLPAGSAGRHLLERAGIATLKDERTRVTHMEPASESPAQLVPMPRLLVAWYGAFDGHGTIGDLLSLKALTSHLLARGYRVDVASHTEYRGIGGRRVDWRVVSPAEYGAFLFVCGPMLRQHRRLQELFQRFAQCRKIGIGVSLLPRSHFNFFDPFDDVLAREGGAEEFGDIAILAEAAAPQAGRAVDGITIGVSLRGEQSEYGSDSCMAGETEEVVYGAANQLLTTWPGRIMPIENHLRNAGVSPDVIEAQYSQCDLVLTSRFHGAMMALRHRVPCVAIDQIRGGAKVHNLVSRTRWPHVYRVDEIEKDELVVTADGLLHGYATDTLLDAREGVVAEARSTLDRLDACVGGRSSS